MSDEIKDKNELEGQNPDDLGNSDAQEQHSDYKPVKGIQSDGDKHSQSCGHRSPYTRNRS